MALTLSLDLQRTLTLTQEEALKLGHDYIGTEHLLLGLLREPGEKVEQVFAHFHLDPEQIRRTVFFIVSRGDRISPEDVGFTPRANKVMELAIQSARRLGSRVVDREHLFCGFIAEGEGISAGVLGYYHLESTTVVEQLLRKLSTS